MNRSAAASTARHAAALARAQWRQARLEELTHIGMGLVRGLGPVEGADERALRAVASRFARLARAVRLVLILADWVASQIAALLRGETLPEPWRAPPASRADRTAPAACVEREPDRDAADPREPAHEVEPPDAPEVPEAREVPAGRPSAEPAERFAYASWNEAIHAICNAFDIADRSRFLEPPSFAPAVCGRLSPDEPPAASTASPTAAALSAVPPWPSQTSHAPVSPPRRTAGPAPPSDERALQ